MPEAPEVRINVDFLNKVFNDSVVCEARINSGRFIKKSPKNWDRLSLELFFLSAAYFKNIKSKGKFIWGEIYIDNKKLWFSNTLGMSGSWTNKDLKHNHISFFTSKGEFISFNDPRCFGTFSIHTNFKLIKNTIDSLGIDFFDEDIYPQAYSEEIQKRINKLKPETQVCEVLMDQSIFCGVGNYLKCELLYLMSIHPATRWIDLTSAQIWIMFLECHKMILKSYWYGGASFKTFKDENGVLSGQYQNEFQVYGKKITNENHPVIKETFNDNRTTHYCPIKQKINFL